MGCLRLPRCSLDGVPLVLDGVRRAVLDVVPPGAAPELQSEHRRRISGEWSSSVDTGLLQCPDGLHGGHLGLPGYSVLDGGGVLQVVVVDLQDVRAFGGVVAAEVGGNPS